MFFVRILVTKLEKQRAASLVVLYEVLSVERTRAIGGLIGSMTYAGGKTHGGTAAGTACLAGGISELIVFAAPLYCMRLGSDSVSNTAPTTISFASWQCSFFCY